MANIIDITIRANDDTAEGVSSASKSGSFLEGIFQGIGQKAAGMLAELPGKALDFFGSAIGMASDLGETVSKNQTIFGAASKDLMVWAEAAPRSLGMTKAAALDATGTFGNLFTQLGITTDQALKMSEANVQMATDFASFHNANPADVLDAMTAAYRGEYDAVQRFVPTINAAKVEEEALAMTHKKSTKELTDKDKALAVDAIMMKNAGAAAGDFARTSDSAANQGRIATAMFEEMKTQIGSALLPAWSALLGFIVGSFLPALSTLGSMIGGVVGPAFAIAADVVKTFVGSFTGEGGGSGLVPPDWLNSIIDLGAQARGAFDTILEAWGRLTSAFSTGMTEDEGSWDGFVNIMEQIGLIAHQVFDWLSQNVPPILAAVGTAFGAVVTAAAPLWEALSMNQNILIALGAIIATSLIVAVWSLVTAVGALAISMIAAALPFIAIVVAIAAVVGALRYAYENWDWFRTAVDGVVQFLIANVPPVFEAIRAAIAVAFEWIISTAVPFIQNAFNSFVGFLQGTLLPAVSTVWNGISAVIGFVATIVMDIVGRIVNFIRDNWENIAQVTGAIWGMISNIISNAWQIISNLIQMFLNIIHGNWSGAWENIKNILSAVWDMMKSTVANSVQFVIGVIGLIVSAVGNVAMGVGGKVAEVVGFFQGLPGRIGGAIAGLAGDMLAAGGRIIQGLIDGIKNKIGGAIDAVKGGLGAIRNLLPFSPAKEGPFSGRGWTLYSGQSMMEGLSQGVAQRAPQVARTMRAALEAAQQAVNAGTGIGTYSPTSPTAAALAAAGAGSTHNWYVQGSIRSDRDLIRLVRDELANAGLSG